MVAVVAACCSVFNLLHHRETACTFSVMAEPQRLKVERRSSEQQQKENRPRVRFRLFSELQPCIE